MGKNFRCGVSKVDITPSIGCEMAGMGRGHIAKSIHDNLYANILILDDGKEKFAIVTADLIGIDIEITEKIKELVKGKINLENFLITASHTHYGPNTRFILPYPEKDISYIYQLCKKIANGICIALRNMKEAKIGMGRGAIKESVNRRINLPDGSHHYLYDEPQLLKYAKGPVDDEVGVICIEDMNSKPIATFFNYTCHPICLPIDNLSISADYPGVAKRLIEEDIGGVAFFSNGACGNIGPIRALEGFQRMGELGENLAIEVKRVLKNIKFTSDVKLKVAKSFVELPIREEIVKRWDMNRRFRNKKTIISEIITFSVNNLVFIGIPGEAFVELGLEIKKKAPFSDTYILYLTNDDLLYIPTKESYKEGGYEVSVAMLGEESYDIILNQTLKLMEN
ncbi:MAG TPA: neutral/alkaline non-lysosomal ceramidase N-terminal domain-containing protein [bacterium]|nr:neutral/alkaline non-lysosomal ceramidase N-terminal domain-containing protein [bacterium]